MGKFVSCYTTSKLVKQERTHLFVNVCTRYKNKQNTVGRRCEMWVKEVEFRVNHADVVK